MVNEHTQMDDLRELRAGRGKVLAETLLVLAAVVAFERLVLGQPLGSFRIHPHPYWLVVLPLAATRGMVAGLVAAALSSMLYAIGAQDALAIDSAGGLLDRHVLSEPCLFLAVGFLIGELHDAVLDQHRGLIRRVEASEEAAARTRRERDALRSSICVLSTRMVDASVQFAEAAEIAERFDAASEPEALALALELVELHCGAWASILVPNKHGVDIAAHRGWHVDERAGRLAAAQRSPVVERALREGVPVNALAPGQELPSEGPLMALPILGAEGVLRAVLAIDHLPLHLLDSTTFETIGAVADWTAGTLRRAAARGTVPDDSDGSGVTVGTPHDLQMRLALEGERAMRYGVPASLVVIQLQGLAGQDVRGRRRMDARVVDRVGRTIRLGDGLYQLGLPGCYVVVAMDADADGAAVLAKRIARLLRPDAHAAEAAPHVDVYGADAVGRDIHAVLDEIGALAAERAEVPISGARPFDVPEQVPPGDADDFWVRLNAEAALALRRGDTFHVIQVHAAHPERDEGHLLRQLGQVTRSRLRPLDTPYLLGPGQAAVVLPYTNRAAAEQVAERLLESLRAMDATPPFGALTADVMAGMENGQTREAATQEPRHQVAG